VKGWWTWLSKNPSFRPVRLDLFGVQPLYATNAHVEGGAMHTFRPFSNEVDFRTVLRWGIESDEVCPTGAGGPTSAVAERAAEKSRRDRRPVECAFLFVNSTVGKQVAMRWEHDKCELLRLRGFGAEYIRHIKSFLVDPQYL
jgi:hypothetical protein